MTGMVIGARDIRGDQLHPHRRPGDAQTAAPPLLSAGGPAEAAGEETSAGLRPYQAGAIRAIVPGLRDGAARRGPVAISAAACS